MASSEVTYSQLKASLTRLLSSAALFESVVYRSTTPKYATANDLLTGEGSKEKGGRWNPVGIAVIYASFAPESAMAEALAHNRYYGIPIEDSMPRTFVAIKAKLQTVLDLRDERLQQELEVSLESMLTEDWRKDMSAGREAITQMLGKAAREIGFEGLIVPSAADPGGHNLLVFLENLRKGSTIEVLKPDRLKG